jgi:hypothetical protein
MNAGRSFILLMARIRWERIVLRLIHFADFPPPKQFFLAEIVLNGMNVKTDHIHLLLVAFPKLKRSTYRSAQFGCSTFSWNFRR